MDLRQVLQTNLLLGLAVSQKMARFIIIRALAYIYLEEIVYDLATETRECSLLISLWCPFGTLDRCRGMGSTQIFPVFVSSTIIYPRLHIYRRLSTRD